MYFEHHHQLFSGLAPLSSAWESCESLDIDPELMVVSDEMIAAQDDAGHCDI